MAIIQLAQLFLGANTQKNPKTNLPEGIGVDARNLDTSHGDLRGLLAASAVHTLSLGAQQKVIYRMGRDTASKTDYWLSRSVDADFCRSLIAEDTTERTYVTDGILPRYTDNTLLGGSPPYPASWVDLGVPAPDSAMNATETTPGSGTEEERVYTDTFLRANGDESAPNASTTTITVNPDSVVTLNSFDAVPSGSHGITKRRIYVSIDGGEFLRVAEITTGTASYVDNGTSRGLVLETGGDVNHPTWLTPPDNLIGLIELWNDMMGGFVGKSYRICEAGHPHAWPIEYEGVLPDTIVGTAKYGTTWVLATTGQAYVVNGTSPRGMADRPTFFRQACVSKRSVVGVGHGVCWAGKFGLCYYGNQGAGVITEGFIDRATWTALDPTSIIGACWGDYYIGFYFDGANRKGFMVNTKSPQGVIWIDQGAFGVFFDTLTDTLFLLGSGNVISEWYAGSATNVTFKTEKTRANHETNPSVAMVVATTYPVTWKLYADGTLKHTQTVTSRDPFRLPGGYVARDFQQEVSAGAGPIEAMVLAEEMGDLP